MVPMVGTIGTEVTEVSQAFEVTPISVPKSKFQGPKHLKL
jgi:hypothetical protein